MKTKSRPYSSLFFILHFSFLLLHSYSAAEDLLTLDEALKLALEQNRDYRIARLEAQEAENNATWGKAGLLPQIDATGQWSRSVNDTRQERAVGGATTVEDLDGAESGNMSAGVGATWTVFEGFSSLAALSRLGTQARIAALRGEEARQTLAADVIVAYGGAVRQKRILTALDSVMAFSRERARLTQGKYSLGSASKLELLQARLDLNADSSARLRQLIALESSKRALNRLLARPEAEAFEVADTVPLSPLPDLAELKARALARNPAYLQAAEGRRLASLGMREYLGNLAPKLGLSAGYNWSRNEADFGIVREGEQSGWTYGANLRMNLFDGGVVRSDLRNARLAVARAELREREAKDRVEAALSEAWTAWRASLELLALEAANLEVARENQNIARERLRLGTIVSLELRDAQEDFLDAETRLVGARHESKRAETELLRLAALLAGGSASADAAPSAR